MSRLRRFQLIEESPSFFLKESSILAPKSLSLNPWFPSLQMEDEFDAALDLLCPNAFSLTSPFDDFDLIQIERAPFYTSAKRVRHRRVGFGSELSKLQSLCDRVSALELGFDRVLKQEEKKKEKKRVGERKYTWTAEIKSPEEDGLDRAYKWVAEIKDGKKGAVEKSCKLTAEIKGKGEDSPISRTYTFKTSSKDAGEYNVVETKKKKEDEDKKKKKKAVSCPRVIEIEEPSDHGAIILRQAYAKSVEKKKGKRKELSPQDAAMIIQMTFRAYLIRRSQALRALRELAIAKTKLKELRALFNNFSYRRQVARDGEERQRFSEKIIVLLLTVDAIEGADIMVRATKKSMVDELEAMLDVVDPQPAGKGILRRRTFDMPDALVQKELAAGVAQVMQMIDESNGAETFEACL